MGSVNFVLVISYQAKNMHLELNQASPGAMAWPKWAQPKSALSPNGLWDQASTGPKWALDSDVPWAQTGPGPNQALVKTGPGSKQAQRALGPNGPWDQTGLAYKWTAGFKRVQGPIGSAAGVQWTQPRHSRCLPTLSVPAWVARAVINSGSFASSCGRLTDTGMHPQPNPPSLWSTMTPQVTAALSDILRELQTDY